MKISTKGRYGLRALIDLALYGKGEHLALCQVAERQRISENYLEQLFSTLRKAGLVISVKGAQGGYVLAKGPAEISVGSVLRILEGNLLIEDTEATGVLPAPDSVQACVQSLVWDQINDAVLGVIDHLSLEDLVNEFKRRTGEDSLMFYI